MCIQSARVRSAGEISTGNRSHRIPTLGSFFKSTSPKTRRAGRKGTAKSVRDDSAAARKRSKKASQQRFSNRAVFATAHKLVKWNFY
jgi:hypothetical protein